MRISRNKKNSIFCKFLPGKRLLCRRDFFYTYNKRYCAITVAVPRKKAVSVRLKGLIFTVILATYARMAGGYDLHIGDVTVALQNSCSTEHKLNVKIGDQVLCAPMTANTVAEKSLRVKLNDTVYTVCNGTCGGGGGGEYVMPETPPEPIVLPETCEWTQTNPNAYLLSDGNQYFDTMVPVNSRNNIEVTAQVINGAYARLFGTKGTSCNFDMTLNNTGRLAIFMGDGSSNSYTFDGPGAKNVYKTETVATKTTYVTKFFYANDTKLNKTSKNVYDCTDANHTMLVLDNDLTSIDQTQSGGIKLYRIRMWDPSKKLIHDFQPVAKGTNICGVTPPTNAMWDFVTKKLYYPAGTGEMGYGVDP